jgi:hypothetical protein
MNCILVGQQVTLSYVFSNKPDFVGGTELTLTIGELTNPVSVQDSGDFIISTYMKISSTYYLVDSATVSG